MEAQCEASQVAQWQMGFPGSEVVKSPPASAGSTNDVGLIPGLGISPGVGNGNPLQQFCLENPMDRGAWCSTVHGGHKESDRAEHNNNNKF